MKSIILNQPEIQFGTEISYIQKLNIMARVDIVEEVDQVFEMLIVYMKESI